METAHDFDCLLDEHAALMRAHADAQLRCSELLRAQAARIADLDAQLMRARAAGIAHITALACEREDRAALAQATPGLERRAVMGRQVQALQARVHELTRQLHRHALAGQAMRADAALPVELAASLAAADLVICQTGCLSHNDYWRVQDHCKRTGKLCMLVDRPDTVHIVRIEHLTTQR